MPFHAPQSAAEVERAYHAYGAAPGGKAMLRAEARAASEAQESGVYITWRSRRSEGAECSRISSASRCFCGHPLAHHAPVNPRDPRAPGCTSCACRAFSFVPSRPEECGMWWAGEPEPT